MKRLGYGLAAAFLLVPVGSHLATGSADSAPSASVRPPKADMHLALQNDIVCYSKDQCRGEGVPERVTMHIDWVRIHPLSP